MSGSFIQPVTFSAKKRQHRWNKTKSSRVIKCTDSDTLCDLYAGAKLFQRGVIQFGSLSSFIIDLRTRLKAFSFILLSFVTQKELLGPFVDILHRLARLSQMGWKVENVFSNKRIFFSKREVQFTFEKASSHQGFPGSCEWLVRRPLAEAAAFPALSESSANPHIPEAALQVYLEQKIQKFKLMASDRHRRRTITNADKTLLVINQQN